MAPSKVSPYSNDEYTVGWISALSSERRAAELMLDFTHGQPQTLHPNDRNVYRLGEINGHKIAIAVLPKGNYGTIKAAVVASDMQMSFTNLRFGLMVGIGGGIPGPERDIRLGDVVVSKPEGTTGGVVHDGRGKQEVEGFRRTGHLNKPPEVLLRAMESLDGCGTFKLDTLYTRTILEHSPFKQAMTNRPEKKRSAFTHPGSTHHDVLFEPTYIHQGDNKIGCASLGCDLDRQVKRKARSYEDPEIHFGIIASGDKVIKDALSREKLRDELGALCAETEAAGLMDNFPCIVIRGICDYCDSHKNDHWQQYAALTAAAYARELLCEIKAASVETLARIKISRESIEASCPKGAIETLGNTLRSLFTATPRR